MSALFLGASKYLSSAIDTVSTSANAVEFGVRGMDSFASDWASESQKGLDPAMLPPTKPKKGSHRRNSSLDQGHSAHSNLLVEVYCCEGLADIQMIGIQVRNLVQTQQLPVY
jgi:hypothetical protein